MYNEYLPTAYYRAILLYGVVQYDDWRMPALAHQCAMEFLAVEANYGRN